VQGPGGSAPPLRYLSDLTWTLVALTGLVLAIDRVRATVRWAIRRWARRLVVTSSAALPATRRPARAGPVRARAPVFSDEILRKPSGKTGAVAPIPAVLSVDCTGWATTPSAIA
jgi:hypothetical protein